MKQILVLSILLLMTACGKQSQNVIIDNHVAPSTGPLTWNQSNFPIQIHIPSDLEANYKVAIENATARWDSALGLNAFQLIYDGVPSTQWQGQYSSLNDDIAGFYRISDWTKVGESTNTLASTWTLSRSGKLSKVDILFNFTNYSFADVDSPPSSGNFIDYESVLTHELGHFLGLNHTTATAQDLSVMNPSISQNQKKRLLSQCDINRIKNLYFGGSLFGCAAP